MGRFEQIYEEHGDAVRAFVRRRAPESVVEDVVSETFLVCWRRLDRVPDQPLPWLYAVARKTLANQRRRLAREQPVHTVGAGWRRRPRRRVRSALGARSGSAAAHCLGRAVAQPGGGRPRLFSGCVPRPLPPRKDAAGATT
jgi:DNA-directed RNA polymerase specialized sigma24 family protein